MKTLTCMMLLISTLILSQGYSVVRYTTENGLPQNSIKDITQDRYGYIWLSTENGILRYDGRHFLGWPNLPLKNLHFRTFYGSREKDHIMIRNQNNQDRLVIRNMSAQTIPVASDEQDDGLSIRGQFYHDYRRSTLTEPIIESHYMIKTHRGRFLFSGDGVRLQPRDNSKEIILRSSFDILQMENTFVAGDKVFLLDPSTGNVTHLTPGSNASQHYELLRGKDVSLYFQQLNGQAFLVKGNTIYLIREHGGQLSFRQLFHYPSLKYNRNYCMYYDEKSDLMYVGSLTKGLLVLRRHIFSCVKQDNPDELPIFNSLLPFSREKVIDPSGRIFSASGLIANLGFNRMNNKDGILYGDTGSIICYRKNWIERYNVPPSYKERETINLGPAQVRYVFKVSGTWFVYTVERDGHVLRKYNNDSFSKILKTYRFQSAISCMRNYDKGKVLIGCMGGLYLLDLKTDRVLKLSGEISVKNIERTRDGNIWLLSYAKGIYLWKGNSIVRMPVDKEGNLNSPHNLLEDDEGYFWISTNNGLYRVFGSRLVAFASDLLIQIQYYRYSTSDGLSTNEFNGMGRPGAVRLDNGSMAFPSMDGIVFFDPSNTPALYPHAASLSIHRLAVGKKVTYFRDRFSLPNDFYRAEVYVDAAYYGNRENLGLEARLDGSDGGKWQPLDSNSIYTIERIEPGEHCLQVRMLINGKGLYITRSLTFFVKPLFYQTRVFRVTLALVLLLLAGALIHIWTRGLRENLRNQKEISSAIEERLSRESLYHEDLLHAVTHDVATPIKHLSNLSRLMLNTTDPEMRAEYFESIYRSTEDLYNHTLELREYRSAFNDDIVAEHPYLLYDLIEGKLNLFRDMAKYGGINVINNIPLHLRVLINKSVMSIIMQNVIDNALKNTRDGIVEVFTISNASTLSVVVQDTGSGMPTELLEYYNGLAKESYGDSASYGRSGVGLHLSIRLSRKINASLAFQKNSPTGIITTLKLDLKYVQNNHSS